jgi:hypothetical protein
MDIEGAERDVLRVNTGWAQEVRVILVEVHSPYTAEGCEDDLCRLGFRVDRGLRRENVVVGVRG